MSCILRVSGESLNVDSLLSEFQLEADRSWKKGEPRTLKGKLYTDSGANFVASGADLDEFNRQVNEATKYLEINAPVISEIVKFPGIQDAVLDFGVSLKEGYVTQFAYLPPKLIQLAASAGIGIEISHYACGNDDGEDS
ncbi:hypothetical protein [Sulfurirhabdus autotrophica]|uniref:DUF4279 domain-containing protein n=1 Tax=Sulfurirhabdus autotrophica TaxID=1706046 RepID=A0A4R3Y914_9PROT|nr:hypothetical protein [Sulfurirhabdus autotrophica]TCV87458.1 hypothetical protein EDC63_105127 [Sulfurirhabdus autotrophica]